MKKTILITMITAVLIGAVSLSAWAYQGQGPNCGKTGAYSFYKNLNLTPDQEQKILVIRQDFQKDTLALRQDLQRKHLELRQLWAAEPINQAAVDAKTKEVNALKIQMINKAKTMKNRIKAVLTPEQQKQLESSGWNDNCGFGRPGRRGCGRF